MTYKSEFVISYHQAKRSGNHHDVRFAMPDSDLWFSSATKKEIPLEKGTKVLLHRTPDHTEENAKFVGTIPEGEYGAGKLSNWDVGKCTILKWKPKRHIVIEFHGKKIKGVYHLLSTSIMGGKKAGFKSSRQSYMFFKGEFKG